MDLDTDDSQTNFLYADVEFLEGRNRTESTYLRPDELPPIKDEETSRFRNEAMVSVTDILSNEHKTSQVLLESPKMVLLRALFDVPKASDDYKAIARWVMTLFQTSSRLMYLMQIAIRQEVQCTHIDSLFRQDTMVCSLASSFLKSKGGKYLKETLSPVISKMAQTKKSYEIDLHKPNGSRNNEKRVRKLVTELLKAIFDSDTECPAAIREFLFYMRSEIRDKYPGEAECTIRSFFFLRFVCPAIVNPRDNGIINRFPSEEAKRGLSIAAKIIQTLANDSRCDVAGKPHLEKLNKLIDDNREKIKTYIERLSITSVVTKEITDNSDTNVLSRKLAIEELQKYMYHKIKSLPLNMSAEEAKKNPVVKLRRALQACSRGNNLTRSTSSPSGSPSHFANRLLAESSPSKRHSYIDIHHSFN